MSDLLRKYKLDKLTVDERQALADALWESVVTEQAAEQQARDDAERRFKEEIVGIDPSRGVPWEVVWAEEHGYE